jgi:hypothetical protein|tara:strand:+ start:991 stop:1473 length:483 start_codon:yes stop_codon:yes gene_type:complete
MPHKKGHDPQIKKAPSKFTSLIRNIKANPQPPYPFIRQIGVGASLLAPLPFGKGNLVKNMGSFVKQAKKVPPISKNPFTGTTKQYIQRSVDNRLKNVISGNLKSSIKQFKPRVEAVPGRNVPIIGKPGQTVKVNNPKTKAVSYVNPRISMTAAERRKAGY